MLTGYLLAILSGGAAALGALSYRYGAKGKVPTIELQTAFFGEKRTRDWYLMVILSLASIVLNR